MRWYRTCQSCNHTDTYKSPEEYKGDTWRDVKCKKCKSIDLDYGSESNPKDSVMDWD